MAVSHQQTILIKQCQSGKQNLENKTSPDPTRERVVVAVKHLEAICNKLYKD